MANIGCEGYFRKCIAAEEHIARSVYRDAENTIRWKENKLPAPSDIVRLAMFHEELIETRTNAKS